jgi:hypothetical protein
MPFRFVSLALSICLTLAAACAAPVEILPPELRGAVQPQLAITPSGRIHLVFGKNNAIYHTASTDGQAFSPPVKVGELEKLALKMRRGPRVAVAGQRVIVTAISHHDGMLHCWTSADDGRTWAEQAPVNSSAKSAREGLHAMAGDGRGFVAVAWLDLRDKGMELWSRVSRDGGATWGSETRVYASPDGHICECCHPSLAIGPKGEIAALWRNWLGGSRDMWLAVSHDGGRTFGETRKLGVETWKLNGCPMDGGAVAFAGDGQSLAVWRREKAIFASATPDREDRLSESGTQPVIQATSRGVLIVWEERGGLMLQRDQAAPTQLAANGRAAAMTAMPDGGAVVAWETPAGAIIAEIVR